MNLQQIFTKGLEHLRKQGKPATNHTGGCLYQAPDGSKCLIGGLIPTGKYTPYWEGKGARHKPIIKALNFTGDVDKLAAMQSEIHDNPASYSQGDAKEFMARMESAARGFADDNGLTYNPPVSA